jgi:hypothetical protein
MQMLITEAEQAKESEERIDKAYRAQALAFALRDPDVLSRADKILTVWASA